MSRPQEREAKTTSLFVHIFESGRFLRNLLRRISVYLSQAVLSRTTQMKLKSFKWTLLQIPKALPQKLAGYKAAMETKLIRLDNLSSISSNLCNKQ